MAEYIVLAILISLSAFFSSSETALFSITPVKTRELLEKNKKGAKVLDKLKKNPKRLIVTILLGNNIVNIAASALATVIATDTFGSQGLGIAIGAMTFLILVFGEIIPKSLAISKAEKMSLLIAKPIFFIMRALFPLVWFFEQITKITGSSKILVTGEEIKTTAIMGLESGVIKKQEEKIIERAIEFADINAEDVMTPRIDVFRLDGNLILEQALPDITTCPFSRIPVYLDDKDNIIGILYVKDVLRKISKSWSQNSFAAKFCYLERDEEGKQKYLNRSTATEKMFLRSLTKSQLKEQNCSRKNFATSSKNDRDMKLIDLAKKPFIIPEKMSINKLFKEFQYRHIHMAVAVDEHGDVMGIVTMEDLLEELVGEIVDETDINKELIMRIDKKTILVDGDTEIDDINDFFNVKLPGKMTDTISAVILEKIEKIPQKNEKIKIDDLLLTIEQVTEREIQKVKIEKP